MPADRRPYPVGASGLVPIVKLGSARGSQGGVIFSQCRALSSSERHTAFVKPRVFILGAQVVPMVLKAVQVVLAGFRAFQAGYSILWIFCRPRTLDCFRGPGAPRGRLIFGGRLIVSGVRGHLADA